MKSHEQLSSNIQKTIQVLKQGGIAIYPTDTVFGIGCCYDAKTSVAKIYQIKNRPTNLPFPLLISDISQIKKITTVTPLAKRLMEKHWPGGLTIVLPGSIGFRMPNNKQLLEIIGKVGVPIVGTSANFHGKTSVKSSGDLDPKLKELVDYVLEGDCPGGIESTVVDATVDQLKIIRQGAITIDETKN